MRDMVIPYDHQRDGNDDRASFPLGSRLEITKLASLALAFKNIRTPNASELRKK